jgi:predicted transcriptional regulator
MVPAMRGEPAREPARDPATERPRGATEPVADRVAPVGAGRESGQLLQALRKRIQAHGYYPHEVAQALGWDQDQLSEETARDLTHAHIIVICEFIGEPVADLWVELGWLSQDDAAEHLRPVVLAPGDYLTGLADCRSHSFPHPVRLGWGSLDREKLPAEIVRLHHYLTWFLDWLECATELDRRALHRRQARAERHPWPRFKAQTWPPMPAEPPIPGVGVLDVVLPPDLASRLKQAAERISVSRQRVTPRDVLQRALEAFLKRNERKADRNAARQKAGRQPRIRGRKR